jgi:general secretion pathway protein E
MSSIHKHTELDRYLELKLIESQSLDATALSRVKAVTENEQVPLDRAILKLGLMEEDLLLPHLAEALNLPHIAKLSEYVLDHERVATLTIPYCQSKVIAPIKTLEGESMLLVSDPNNHALIKELSFYLDGPLLLVIAPTRVIRVLIATSSTTDEKETSEASEERLKADQSILRQGETDGPVIRFVSEVFDEAVSSGASDIHFEAQEDGLRIRVRRQGILQTHPIDQSLNMASILARVKVMASMNVSERRLPQDGRITSNIAGRKVDFRVSSVPTSFGESIVARVLDPKALRLGWDKLGFSPETVKRIIEIIEQPSGLFLVTGPTGSGKTTTLYTALAHLNQEGRKILTVEDPIEYNLPGVEQVQVHEEIGMTFAKALRSFLRQDPNIIMVGEIRDEETAEIACRAALVGRMVLSTLHTNSPQGAVTRLVDLGVPKYIVQDVLRGVLGQRLEVIAGEKRRLTSELHKISGQQPSVPNHRE